MKNEALVLCERGGFEEVQRTMLFESDTYG